MAIPALSIETDLAADRAAHSSTDANELWLTISLEIVNGEQRAFARYYESFFDLMFHEASRLSGRDESFCLDMVHDSMLKAMHSMKPMSSFSALSAWSKAVVRSVVYDAFRLEQRDRKQLQQIDAEGSTENEAGFLEREARLCWIEEQVREMDTELRKMFRWRYRWGWTLKRIAQKLGLKTGAVDGRIRREISRIQAKSATGETDGVPSSKENHP